MTRPTLSQAEAWRPDSLRRLADGWDDAARNLAAHVDAVMREIRRSHEFWTGAAADAARDNARGIAAAGDDAARHLVIASVAARNGADQITAAQSAVQTRVAEARDGGFDVADDGTVSIRAGPPPLLVALSGGDPAVARDLLTVRAGALSKQVTDALDRLGAADTDAARDIEEAFASSPTPRAAATVPAGAWPVQASDVVAGWRGMGPGPHRHADRRHDTSAAAAAHCRVPPAGRQHRRRALGHAGRRQPHQHRSSDCRRIRRSGSPAADRVLPQPAR